MSTEPEDIFNIGKINGIAEDDAIYYATFTHGSTNDTSDDYYMCTDGELRRWTNAVKEFGVARANEMILHKSAFSLKEYIKDFEDENPEYYV